MIKRILQNKPVILVARWILAVVFIYAGIGKILDPGQFAQDIDNYRLLPYVLVTLMAAILPWLEVLCGLLLIFGRWMLGASFILAGLNFIFLFAISAALARGLDISCGCFSAFGEGAKVGLPKLVEDLGLLLLSIVIFFSAYLSFRNNNIS